MNVKGRFYRLLSGCLLVGLLTACAQPATPVVIPPTSTPVASLPATPASTTEVVPAAVLAARQILAQQSGLQDGDVRIINYEKVEWPDKCLGVVIKGMMCAQGITPGYKVTLEAAGKQYEYHTNEDGGTVLLAVAPPADVQDAALVWQSQGGLCETAQIGSNSLAFGPCSGALMAAKFVSPERAAELAEWVQTYQSFQADTLAGSVTFTGKGSRTATPAEQRSLAEWAHLVFMEAAGGRGGAAYGLALSWHREGGIAGFCDDVAIYLSGEVVGSSCKGQQAKDLGRARLSDAQLIQLYAWVDGLKSFDYEQKDPAAADAMSQRLTFAGNGAQEASADDKAGMLTFASQVYASLGQK